MLPVAPIDVPHCVRHQHRGIAADVAISSTFGPNTLKSFKVRTDEVSEG